MMGYGFRRYEPPKSKFNAHVKRITGGAIPKFQNISVDTTYVNLFGGTFEIPEKEIPRCVELLAQDLVSGAEILNQYGSRPLALSEIKRAHKLVPAVFDFDPKIRDHRLGIEDMIAVARCSVLPTLLKSFPRTSLPGSREPALVILMAAERDEHGTLTVKHKCTTYLKCGLCKTEGILIKGEDVWYCPDTTCQLKYNAETCVCEQGMGHANAEKRIVYKSGAHFRCPQFQGPYVSEAQSTLMVSYASALLKKAVDTACEPCGLVKLPLSEAEFDEAVCTGSGLRVPYCMKMARCPWCKGAAADVRKHVGCSVCMNSGKVRDDRRYHPVAVLDIDGRELVDELEFLHDPGTNGYTGVLNTLKMCSIRPPLHVTAPTEGFRSDEMESCGAPRVMTAPPAVHDFLMFEDARFENKKGDSKKIREYVERRNAEPSAKGKGMSPHPDLSSHQSVPQVVNVRSDMARRAHRYVMTVYPRFNKTTLVKMEKDKGSWLLGLDGIGATLCMNATVKKSDGRSRHESSKVFFLFQYRKRGKTCIMRQGCGSTKKGKSGHKCKGWVVKNNEHRVNDHALISMLFPGDADEAPRTSVLHGRLTGKKRVASFLDDNSVSDCAVEREIVGSVEWVCW